MKIDLILEMVFHLVGGLGIFLLGMKYMQQGLQVIAGSRIRRMISLVTSNRFLAVGIGLFVTTLVQSSSRRVTRTTFRALPRSGRHATNAFAKTRKYTQAPPHARGRIQSRDSDVQSHRQGHAEGIRGAQRQSDRCFIALRLDHRRTFCPAAIHRASQLGRSAESHLP